jgi:hypothetical protein
MGMHAREIQRTLCAVKMRVAHLDRYLHRVDYSLINLALFTSLVPCCSRAITKHGHRIAIVQLEVGDCEV